MHARGLRRFIPQRKIVSPEENLISRKCIQMFLLYRTTNEKRRVPTVFNRILRKKNPVI